MTCSIFRKKGIFFRLIGIFEFCKRQCIKNFLIHLDIKIQLNRGLKKDFKKYFHISQGQGHTIVNG